MRNSCTRIHRWMALLLAGTACIAAANAQNAPAWVDQLKSQYKLVRFSADMNGVAVVQQGTVLAIQKPGIRCQVAPGLNSAAP